MNGGTQANLVAKLPTGNYRAEWLNPKTGTVEKTDPFTHPGGDKTLVSPAYTEDIALRILATGN